MHSNLEAEGKPKGLLGSSNQIVEELVGTFKEHALMRLDKART